MTTTKCLMHSHWEKKTNLKAATLKVARKEKLRKKLFLIAFNLL